MINRGHGVSLGPISENERLLMFKWRNDERVFQWCRQPSLLTWEGHAQWFKSMQTDPTVKMFTIWVQKDEGAWPVGVCGLTDINQLHQRAEFSCYVAPEFRGSGYSRSALKTLFDHGFDDLNLNLIWGETFEGNHALRIFTDDLGMKVEGARRDFYFKRGQFIDATLISLKRTERSWINGVAAQERSDHG